MERINSIIVDDIKIANLSEFKKERIDDAFLIMHKQKWEDTLYPPIVNQSKFLLSDNQSF